MDIGTANMQTVQREQTTEKENLTNHNNIRKELTQ